MGWESKEPNTGKQKKLLLHLSPDQEKILELLRLNGESGIDYIVSNAQLSPTKVASVLLELEFEGILKCLPGKVYKIVN